MARASLTCSRVDPPPTTMIHSPQSLRQARIGEPSHIMLFGVKIDSGMYTSEPSMTKPWVMPVAASGPGLCL